MFLKYHLMVPTHALITSSLWANEELEELIKWLKLCHLHSR